MTNKDVQEWETSRRFQWDIITNTTESFLLEGRKIINNMRVSDLPKDIILVDLLDSIIRSDDADTCSDTEAYSQNDEDETSHFMDSEDVAKLSWLGDEESVDTSNLVSPPPSEESTQASDTSYTSTHYSLSSIILPSVADSDEV